IPDFVLRCPCSFRYFNTPKLRSYLACMRTSRVSLLTVSILCETTSGATAIILSRCFSIPWKSGIKVSKVVSGFILRTAFTVSAHIILPISLRSSLSTLVKTACFICIIFIERATFSGSSQSTFSGLPVFTPQNPQERVHMFPNIIKVAVPSPQHSPMFGQLPEVQMVFSLYLSTKPLSSVYFFPVGSFTRSHLGFGCFSL